MPQRLARDMVEQVKLAGDLDAGKREGAQRDPDRQAGSRSPAISGTDRQRDRAQA